MSIYSLFKCQDPQRTTTEQGIWEVYHSQHCSDTDVVVGGVLACAVLV